MDKPKPTPTPMSERATLWDEYELLQNKIDRIGEFRFKVKGWAVTVVFVGLATLAVTNGHPIKSAMFFIATALFWSLETYQASIGREYGDRATHLERSFARTARPGIAKAAAAGARGRGRLGRLARWINRPNVFYLIVAIVVLIVVALQSIVTNRSSTASEPVAASESGTRE